MAPPVAVASPTLASLAEVSQLLRNRDDPASAVRLAEILRTSAEPTVRARAAGALGMIGGSTAQGALTDALHDQAPIVRVWAVDALRRTEGTAAIVALQGVFGADQDQAVRRAAVRALAALDDPAATAILSAAAGDPDPSVRREVTRALRRLGIASDDP
jgi:HEAT repeat protein